MVSLQIVGFECLKELYKKDEDFTDICTSRQPAQDFHILDEFLLKGSRLCVPRTSLREKVIKDLHRGGLAGHFEREDDGKF